MVKDDAYEVLMAKIGFPGSVRLRIIMEEMMTPDQAQMVAVLPGSAKDVAAKTGFNVGRVKSSLEELFYKGAVLPRGDFHNRTEYRWMRSIGQFHDSAMASETLDIKKDRPHFELWYDFVMNEMYPRFAERFLAASKGRRPWTRIVPAWQSIKDLPGVLPCENFHEILKAQSRIATAPCSCRMCTASVGKTCAVHDEVTHPVCFQFHRGADYVVERGSGKELTLKEAKELNDIMEKSGLLHIWINTTQLTGPKTNCNCCRDCCMNYVPMDMAKYPIGLIWDKSRYQAYVNDEDCTGCQVCVDRCQFDAIEMVKSSGSKKYKASVIAEKCFGCGVCVLGCEPEAMKMKAVRPPEYIPVPVAAAKKEEEE
ncbi:MAG: 4Fe-4S binding protein [Dehalococcoidales bacterium]|nr:4Fe-4S binding protein [Dehalococcoidales bacterium]